MCEICIIQLLIYCWMLFELKSFIQCIRKYFSICRKPGGKAGYLLPSIPNVMVASPSSEMHFSPVEQDKLLRLELLGLFKQSLSVRPMAAPVTRLSVYMQSMQLMLFSDKKHTNNYCHSLVETCR